MRTNEAGLSLIRRFEGLSLTAKPDTGALWQIGYGHTHGVHEGDTITEEKAEQFLRDDLYESEFAVGSLVNVDLNQNQFSALVSLVYNIGASKFNTSSLRKLLNDGDFESAASEFHKFDHAGGQVVRGLTRRRQAEEELFRRPAPKPLGKSRTMQAGSVAAASTTVYGITDQLRDAQDMLSGFTYIRMAQYALVAITLLGVGVMLYSRLDDHRRGLR